MARPKTDALIYFNIDVKEDDNLKYIEALYGHLGYYIVHKLWKHIYGGPGGYYCEWGEINQRLFCKENNISIDKLKEIIETCFSDEIKLFNREMFNKNKILTSSGVQKRWKKIVTEAGRKSCHIKPDYDLTTTSAVSLTPPETTPPLALTGSNSPIPPPETTQSKVKESKEKESKPTVLSKTTVTKSAFPATANAVPGQKTGKVKKMEESSRMHWQAMVDGWFDFYKKNYGGEEPNFKDRNPKWFEKIYDLLHARAKKKNQEWTEKYAIGALNFFLENAIADKWLKEHFLLENLHKQFDSVFANAKEKSKQTVQDTRPKSFDEELKFIVNRMNEGDFDDRVITHEYYEKLVVRGYLQLGSYEKSEGDTVEEKKRNSAMYWFRHQVESLQAVA